VDAVERLVRWERAGGTWRVVGTPSPDGVTIALDTCHGEEMERLTSADAELVAFVGLRSTSEDQEPPGGG
jgi:hypothetical protein